MAVYNINRNSYLQNNHITGFKSSASRSSSTSIEDNTVSGEKRRLQDDEVRLLASLEPDKRFSIISKNVAKTLLATIPLMDITVNAVTKRGNLSSKIMKGTKTAALWASVFAAGAVVQSVKSFANSRVEFLDKLNKDHAVAATAMDFTAIWGTFLAILNTGTLLRNTFNTKYPALSKKIHRGVKEPIKNFLNQSFLNKKVIRPAEIYLNKHPQQVKANKLFTTLLVPTMFTGTVLRYIHEAKNHDRAFQDNYRFLRNLNDMQPDNTSTGQI